MADTNSNPVDRIFPHLEVRKQKQIAGKWDYWILPFASKRQNFLV
jgi:hypothetical protein